MPVLRRLAALAVALIAGCAAPVASAPASPQISCVGIPAARCDEAVASVERSLPNTAPVSIEVICVSGACTPESGAMDTVVTLTDGSQLRSTTVSWSDVGGGDPGQGKPFPPPEPIDLPALPVQPECQGVPVSMCTTMAETAFGEVSAESVVQILVRCGEPPCTDEHGVGDTLVIYADGTSRTTSWEYAGG